MKHKRLKSDGGYGCQINGYSDAALKEQFLRDARAWLRDTGKLLAARGLTEMEVSVNPGGVAVSGEVSAAYWRPDDPARRVYACVDASALGWGRSDGLIVMARVQHYRETPANGRKSAWRMGQSGPNQWLSANFDSRELADRLWAIFDPAATPETMTAFTSEGAQAIPSPFVHNDREAVAWQAGMEAVTQSFAADNERAAAVAPAPVPIALSLFNEIEAQAV